MAQRMLVGDLPRGDVREPGTGRGDVAPGKPDPAQSARVTVEAIHAMTLQSEKAQSSQQEMLKQLRTMSESFHSPRSFDWNPVSFQLTEETPEGPPAVGFWITLTGQAPEGGKGGVSPSTHLSDRSGIADFGVVHPGRYSFNISKSWDQGSVNTSGELIIDPGSQTKKTVVCPKTPLERVPVRVLCSWPDDLEKEGLVLYATFRIDPIKGEDVSWSYHDNSNFNRFSVLYGPKTAIAEVLNFRGPCLWMNESPAPVKNVWADLLTSDLHPIKQSEEAMKWVQGTYHMAALYVLRPHESAIGERRKHFELVVASSHEFFISAGQQSFRTASSLEVAELSAPPTEEEILVGNLE